MQAATQLLSGLVAQLGRDSGVAVLSPTFAQHATSALAAAQPALRALPPLGATAASLQQQQPLQQQQQQQLREVTDKLLDAVSKRAGKGKPGSEGQLQAICLLAACIRAIDTTSLLERAVGWATQLTDAIRKAAAAASPEASAAQPQQQGMANGSAAPLPSADAADALLQPADPGAAAVVQAACAAAAKLFARLQPCIELPAARREVTSIVPKLLQQLLSVLGSGGRLPDACHVAALQLLAALLQCVPSSLRAAAASLERVLQQQVLRAAASSAGSSVAAGGGAARWQLLAQAARCAALLPAVPGDAAAWSDTARRLLLSCHDVLDQLLMGLEDRPLDPQYRTLLTQQAATETGWLASLPWEQQKQQQRRQTTVPALLLLSTCLTALQQLLAQPFGAAAVPLPAYSLALLAARLLRFDAGAAVAAGAVPASSTAYQELLVLQPQLQEGGWRLLQLVVASCGGQLQLQAVLLRILRQGLRTVQLSGPAALASAPVGVRCCLYQTASQLLEATGLAGVRAIAAEVMGCVVLELYGSTAAAAAGGGGSGQAGAGRPSKRARKSGNELGQFDPAAAAAATAAGSSDPAVRLASAADLSAQTAALQLLRQLLQAGGQLLPAEVRAHADAVAFHISATTAEAECRLQHQASLSSAAAAASAGGSLVGLQLAAYDALLTSVLVPCSHRPPFLGQAVLLFRQGRSSSSAAVAGACQAAAVQVEALLHPRATAMSSVRQYAGMDAVPALSRPRFWSALLSGAVDEGGDATAAGAAGGHAALAAAEAAAAAAGGAAARPNGLHPAAAPDVVVLGSPVQPQVQSQVLPSAAAAGAGGADNRQPPAPKPAQHQQQPQPQQQQAPLAPASVPALQQQPVADPMEADDGAEQVLQQHPPAAAAVQVGGPAASGLNSLAGSANGCQPAPPARAAATAAAAAALYEDESSDSEGPLPDIDSGDAGDDGSSSSEEGDA